MRISDWSSDVCSSDLGGVFRRQRRRMIISAVSMPPMSAMPPKQVIARGAVRAAWQAGSRANCCGGDRKSVVSGQSVSVRVDLGGRRIIKKQTTYDKRYSMNLPNKQSPKNQTIQ